MSESVELPPVICPRCGKRGRLAVSLTGKAAAQIKCVKQLCPRCAARLHPGTTWPANVQLRGGVEN